MLGPFGSGCVCNAASFQIKRLEDGNNRCFFPPPPPIPNPPGYGLGGMVQGEAFRLTECVNYAAVAFNVEWVNVAPFYYITLHHRPIMVSSTTDHYRGRYGDVAGIGGTVPLPHQNCIETPGCSPCTDQVRNLRDRLDVDWRCDYTALPPVVVGYDYYQNNVYAPFSINDASAGDGIGYWEQTASGGLMMRLMPGVYCSNSRGYIEVPSGGTLVLDANFDPKAVFVFRAELIITLFEGSVVTFINNASAVNVLWISKGAVTVGPVEYRGPSTAGLPLPQSDVRTLASGIFISTSTTRHAMALRQTKLEGQFLSVAWYNDIWVQGNSEIHVPGAEYFTPPPSVIPSSSSSTGPFESSSSSSTAPAQSSSSSSSTGPSERSSSSSTARAQSSSSSSSSTGPASSSSSTGASVRSSSSSTGREKSSSSSSSTGRSSSSSSSSSSTGASSSSTSVGESSSSSGDAVSAIVEDVSFLNSDAGLAIIAGTGAVAIAGIGIAAYCIKAGAQAVQVATSAL